MPNFLYDHIPALVYFLEQLDEPLAITGSEGQFLWVNNTWEDEFEYTLAEYTREIDPVLWTEMTSDKKELEIDLSLSRKMADDEVWIYHIVKEYETKTRKHVPVKLTVLRWPMTGDFEFALVHARVLNAPEFKNLARLSEMIQSISNDKLTPAEAVGLGAIRWAQEHPKVISFWFGLLFIMIFGRYGVDVLLYLLEKVH